MGVVGVGVGVGSWLLIRTGFRRRSSLLSSCSAVGECSALALLEGPEDPPGRWHGGFLFPAQVGEAPDYGAAVEVLDSSEVHPWTSSIISSLTSSCGRIPSLHFQSMGVMNPRSSFHSVMR